MGRQFSADLANSLKMEAALEIHLRHNHFPPVPLVMVQVCLEAINAFNEDEPDRMVDLPDGVMFKDGSTSVPAHVAINSFHLHEWLNGQDV